MPARRWCCPATCRTTPSPGCAASSTASWATCPARSRVPRPRARATFAPLDRAATQLVVYTSGTNGEPLAIAKKLAQLDAEVHALEARFGALCDTGLAPVNLAPETFAAGAARSDAADTEPPTVVWATVTHQHIYGLLFRVLWPLAAGRPFAAERLVFNEEIAQRIHGPAVLVASPAHLRRLPEAIDWSPVRAGLRAVFSSGGPLPPEAADATLALLGAAPVEVYGSSETGGVAWRQRARHGDTWQPLPGIEFRVDGGELAVRSPHLPDLEWFRTADRATPAADGMDGFELHGRADRIVKIEEKRVSLTALEQRLATSDDVAEARVLMLADERPVVDAAGVVLPHAVRPAVVAVLSEAGRAKLAARRQAGPGGRAAGAAAVGGRPRGAAAPLAPGRRAAGQRAGQEHRSAFGRAVRAAVAERPLRPEARWRIAEPAHAQASLALDPELRSSRAISPAAHPARRRAGALGDLLRARALRHAHEVHSPGHAEVLATRAAGHAPGPRTALERRHRDAAVRVPLHGGPPFERPRRVRRWSPRDGRDAHLRGDPRLQPWRGRGRRRGQRARQRSA